MSGDLVNAELIPPSRLIGREVSDTQRPMASLSHWMEVVDAPKSIWLFLRVQCRQYEAITATKRATSMSRSRCSQPVR